MEYTIGLIFSLSVTALHTIDYYDQSILYIVWHTIISPMAKHHYLRRVYYYPVHSLNFISHSWYDLCPSISTCYFSQWIFMPNICESHQYQYISSLISELWFITFLHLLAIRDTSTCKISARSHKSATCLVPKVKYCAAWAQVSRSWFRYISEWFFPSVKGRVDILYLWGDKSIMLTTLWYICSMNTSWNQWGSKAGKI